MQDDKQNNNPESIELETEFAEHEGVVDEGWQHDAPPEDDFHDTESSSDELIEEASIDETAYDAPEADKRRGNVVFFAIVGFVLLVVGGLAFLQFGGMKSADDTLAPVAPTQASAQMAAPPASSPEGATPVQAPASTSELDLNDLYKDASAPQPILGEMVPPAAAPVPQITDSSTDIMTLEGAAKPQPEAQAPTITSIETIPLPQPAPVSEAETKAVETALGGQETTAPAPAPVIAQPIDASSLKVTELEDKLKGLSSKLETLEKELDRSTQKNLELVAKIEELEAAKAKAEKAKMEAPVVPAVPQAAQPEAMKSDEPLALSLDKLAAPKDEVADQKSVSAKTAKSKSAPKTKKAQTTAKTKSTTKAKKAGGSKEVAAPDFVLRAATPDAAWISKDMGSSDLQRVTVGDELPGIGQIKEIRQNGDRWELVGSKTTLR